MANASALSLDFASRNPQAFARTLSQGKPREIAAILTSIPGDDAAAVVARMPIGTLNELVASGIVDARDWLTAGSYDDAVKIAGRLPRDHSLALINSLDDKTRRSQLLQYLKYPAHSVGAAVSDVLVRIAADSSAGDALREIRAFREEPPGAIVLTEADGSYFGLLDAWSLLLADKPIGKARDYASKVTPLHPETPLVDAVTDANWRNWGWLPVVDYRQRVIGAASRDQVMEHLAIQGDASSRRADFFGLLQDMIRVFAALLERLLFARVRP